MSREPLDVRVLVAGCIMFLTAAVLYAQAARVDARKDRELARLRRQLAGKDKAIEGLDGLLAAVEGERDEAIANWTGWFKRAMEAETDRDQARLPARRIRCRAVAGRGAP